MAKNYEVHQLVKLKEAIPEIGILQGQSGTIIHLYEEQGLACEVEFISSDGFVSHQVTLQLSQIEPLKIDPLVAATENHGSNELLELNPDTKVSSLESLKSSINALKFLHELVAKDTATVGVRHNTLGIVRSQLKHLENSLGAKDDIEQQEELKRNLLLQANSEIKRLREEIGKGVTIESIGSKLHQLDRTIYNWWQNLGFSYASTSLMPNHRGATFKVEFSVDLDRHISVHSSTPVTDKAKIDVKIADLGKELEITLSRNDDPYILDNTNNRTWLIKKFKERFPNCKIWKWESIAVRSESTTPQENEFKILRVEVNIDMNDVGDTYEKNTKYE